MRGSLLTFLSTVAALETINSTQFEVLELNATTRSNLTISAAWYTGWHAKDFPLSQVSWEKYTHLIYAFAWVIWTRCVSLLSRLRPFFFPRVTTPEPTALSLALQMRRCCHNLFWQPTSTWEHSFYIWWTPTNFTLQDVKALLSLGGWTGSRWFSTNVGTANNRTAFVKLLLALRNNIT